MLCLAKSVYVKPDVLHVCKNNQPLRWTIKTVGYVFANPSGVDFKGNHDFDKESWGGAPTPGATNTGRRTQTSTTACES
jgi:hypothetical protein